MWCVWCVWVFDVFDVFDVFCPRSRLHSVPWFVDSYCRGKENRRGMDSNFSAVVFFVSCTCLQYTLRQHISYKRFRMILPFMTSSRCLHFRRQKCFPSKILQWFVAPRPPPSVSASSSSSQPPAFFSAIFIIMFACSCVCSFTGIPPLVTTIYFLRGSSLLFFVVSIFIFF